jgi:hypothetical protein
MRNDRPTDAAVIELIETAKHVDALLTRNDIGNRSSSDAHPLRLRFRKAIDAFKPRTIEIGYSLTNRSHFAKDSDTALCGYRFHCGTDREIEDPGDLVAYVGCGTCQKIYDARNAKLFGPEPNDADFLDDVDVDGLAFDLNRILDRLTDEEKRFASKLWYVVNDGEVVNRKTIRHGQAILAKYIGTAATGGE